MELAEHLLETVKPARRPNEATQFGKAVFHEGLHYLNPDEAIRPGYQDPFIREANIF